MMRRAVIHLLRPKRLKQNLAVQVADVRLSTWVLIHAQSFNADVLKNVQQILAEGCRA
ncbi:hypothetical protein D3C71_2183550 [compost metagenome]